MESIGDVLIGVQYVLIPFMVVVGFGFGVSRLDKEMLAILACAFLLFLASVYLYCFPVDWAGFAEWCQECFVPREGASYPAQRRILFRLSFIAAALGYLLARLAGWWVNRV